jgi:serine/threonine-protein kinase
MPLPEGTVFGSYRIVSLLGVGGMGEVYRARDAKLNRDVALKVLPEAFASDADRLARFTREAQVLASLNHANIGAIYGVEEGALVLELVDGPTLADRMAQGPMSIGEALPVARQIAEALEAAHEQGVIHRDLKPANIKLRPDGTTKVLDFGLAAVVQGPDPRQSSATMSPTLTIAATQAGLIMGTAAYMSPEQAAGKAVDKRSDIWSFGVLLWEMLTGRRMFDGETISHTLADVLRADIEFDALPVGTPPALRDLVRRCLDRNAKSRLRDIGEARVAIERAQKEHEIGARPLAAQRSSRWIRGVPWVVAAMALVIAAALVVMLAPWKGTPPSPVRRFSVDIGEDVSLVTTQGTPAVLSPDGQTLAFVARTPVNPTNPQIYIRRLGQLQAAPLSGTENATSPFFSPDGQWIGFFSRGAIKKISSQGGAAVTVTASAAVRGASWGEDGTIVFEPDSNTALMRVSADGGKPQPATMLAQGEATHRWPQILPGGKGVLYTAHTDIASFDEANIVVLPFPGGTPKIVQRGGSYGRYVSSGHVIYVHENTLFAVPFDLAHLETTGSPVPVINGVDTNTVGGALFDVSRDGTLVYLPGSATTAQLRMDWLDRSGRTTVLRATAADWSNLLFSPDGQLIAFDLNSGSRQTDVWIYDWTRDVLTPLTRGGVSQKPVWTADGRRLVFASRRDGPLNLYWQRSDGTGEVQRLTQSPNGQGAWSWHPNGKLLAFHELSPQQRDDIWILPIEGNERDGWKPGKPTMFVGGPDSQRAPMFSPDGRWLAYQSNESGRDEIYVVTYPGGTNRVKVSNGGGVDPTWSRARPELVYATSDQRIMVVPYQVKGDALLPEKPQPWSDIHFVPRYRLGPTRSFDLHPDGNRVAFAVASDAPAAKQTSLVFVLDFFDELRRLAPPK